MNRWKIVIWLMILTCPWFRPVQAQEESMAVPVYIEGPGATVAAFDMEGKEAARVELKEDGEGALMLPVPPLTTVRYTVRQLETGEGFDPTEWTITVMDGTDEKDRPMKILVAETKEGKKDKVVFYNKKNVETEVPKTGDRSRTGLLWAMLILSFGACVSILIKVRKEGER